MELSFQELPPTHFLTLKYDHNSPDELWACWTRFRRCLKAAVHCEYYLEIEEGETEKPHIHLLIRTDAELEKDLVRSLWARACCSSNVRVYCHPVESARNSAHYLPKHWYDRQTKKMKVPWLPGKEWKNKKLVQLSRGFLSESKASLWKKVKQNWFGDKPEPDWDEIPVWKEPDALKFIIYEQNDGTDTTDHEAEFMMKHFDSANPESWKDKYKASLPEKGEIVKLLPAKAQGTVLSLLPYLHCWLVQVHTPADFTGLDSRRLHEREPGIWHYEAYRSEVHRYVGFDPEILEKGSWFAGQTGAERSGATTCPANLDGAERSGATITAVGNNSV